MKGMLLGAAAATAAALAAAAIVLAAGWVDVGADTPHGPIVHDVIEFARERSIARATRDVAPPADLASAERIRRGAGNYEAMCVDCHLAPGEDDSEIRRGLYPRPPNLSRSGDPGMAPDRAAARRYWIIKHGIKASGMPAWAKGGMSDDDIWDLSAFVGVLPTLTPQQYRQQVAASGGHSHGGRPQAAVPPPPAHDHRGHAH